MNTFVEGQQKPEALGGINYPHLPLTSKEDYRWAEQLYCTGEITAVVAIYKNIPQDLQNKLNQLISDTYRKKLITVPFLKASLLLLESGVMPAFQSLNKTLKVYCPAECLDYEQQKLIEFVTTRDPNDIVVMVLRSDRLIATMTLFPFNNKCDIPSLSYLDIGSAVTKLPDVPALEVGRLAKITCNGYDLVDPKNSFIDMASMAAAFIVSQKFISQNDMLENPESFICGDTHGTLVASLKRYFPLKVFDSHINPDMLESDSNVRGMSIHFIQRQVLGSFESVGDLLSAIRKVAAIDPVRALRIERLLNSGLDRLGISSIHRFDPKRFRVQFFHFPYHHPETATGLARMEHMMRWLTTRPDRTKKILH